MVEALRTIRVDEIVCELRVDEGRYVFYGPRGCLSMARGPGEIGDDSLDAHWDAFVRSQGLSVLCLGQDVDVVANNGSREGVVLSVIDDKVIVEYSMPCGSTSLRVVDRVMAEGPIDTGRSLSYWSVPNKWLSKMVEDAVEWSGRPQQSPRALRPSEMMIWKRARARLGFGHTVVRPVSSVENDSGFGVVFHGPTLNVSVRSPARVLSSCGFEVVEKKPDGWQTWRYVGDEE